MKRLSLDLGDFRELIDPNVGPHERWHSHGDALVLTMADRAGIEFDRKSLRLMSGWGEWRAACKGYDLLTLNVRSYSFPMAYRAAKIFKDVNPGGVVVTGGMHSTVATEEMTGIDAFDHIVVGNSELTFPEIVSDPGAFPRVVQGKQMRSMDDWPMLDRAKWWPRPDPRQGGQEWPLENGCGWAPPPSASIITSRVCPWACAFCNESSYIQQIGRRSVDSVIDELNWLDEKYGPIGSVVIHDSMFFQQPKFLHEWLDKYPRKARKPWPYWAAARADTVRAWPELFEALVRETNWHTVSIGFESGSDRVLKILNKETTASDNYYAIDLLNRIGDDMEAKGQIPPKFFTNIIFAVPGETREDAFETVRMVKSIKRCLPSIAYWAGYPGAAMGYSIIAEGKSLMDKDNYHRFPGQEKVKGIDYAFYNALLTGAYDHIIDRGAPLSALVRSQGTDGIYQDGTKDKRHMFNLSEALTKA